MKVYGNLEAAAVESLASNPAGNVTGRFWWNSTTLRLTLDDGTNKLAILRNDQVLILGTSGTAANNVRINRGANALLQFVTGGDTTAEGTLSTSLAQISARLENYTNAAKPAFGNAGRSIYITDLADLYVDTGSAWKAIGGAPLTTKGDLYGYSTVDARVAVGTNGQFLKADSSTATGLAWDTIASAPAAFNTYTTTQTLSNSNDIVLLDSTSGAFTVTLHTAVGNTGKILTLERTDGTLANPITLATTSGQTIGGIASGAYALYTAAELLRIVSNGTNWIILDHETTTAEVDAGQLAISSSHHFDFTITSATVASNTVYSHNGQIYTVSTGIAPSTLLRMAGSGAPSASGTLTYVSGPTAGDRTFSSVATNTLTKGTITYENFYWVRNGKNINFRFEARYGAGTAGSGDYVFRLPATLRAEMTNLRASMTNVGPMGAVIGDLSTLGSGMAGNASSALRTFIVYLGNTEYLKLANTTDGVYGASTGNTNLATALSFSVTGSYPVVGWQP